MQEFEDYIKSNFYALMCYHAECFPERKRSLDLYQEMMLIVTHPEHYFEPLTNEDQFTDDVMRHPADILYSCTFGTGGIAIGYNALINNNNIYDYTTWKPINQSEYENPLEKWSISLKARYIERINFRLDALSFLVFCYYLQIHSLETLNFVKKYAIWFGGHYENYTAISATLLSKATPTLKRKFISVLLKSEHKVTDKDVEVAYYVAKCDVMPKILTFHANTQLVSDINKVIGWQLVQLIVSSYLF